MTEPNPDYRYEAMADGELPSSQANAAPLFDEAPSVIFTQLYAPKGGQVVQFNLTCRANTAREAIDQIIDGINYAKSKGFSVIRPMGETPTMAATPAPDAHAATTTPAPVSAPAAARSSAAPAANGSAKTIHAVFMGVQPKPDGKVTIEWFCDGHKYADIYTTRSIESAVNLLATTGSWTADHLKEAVRYKVNHLITWKDSEKLNSKGNPYKDLLSITAE